MTKPKNLVSQKPSTSKDANKVPNTNSRSTSSKAGNTKVKFMR